MPSVVSSPIPPGEIMFRLSVAQYHQMIDSGTLTADDPVELVEGILLYKMPRKPSHSGTVEQAADLMRPLLPAGWRYRLEQPITLEDGEPAPDGALTSQSLAQGFVVHPTPPQLALVIEVADTTLDRDRGIKLRSYARAGIPFYWIINLIDLQVEVYSVPVRDQKTPCYRDVEIFTGEKLIPLILDGQKIAEFSAAALLPPV